MCLTIPKKVISIDGKKNVIIEDFKGNRQEAKSIVELKIGDYCLTQQNVVVQKIDEEYAAEIFDIINGK